MAPQLTDRLIQCATCCLNLPPDTMDIFNAALVTQNASGLSFRTRACLAKSLPQAADEVDSRPSFREFCQLYAGITPKKNQDLDTALQHSQRHPRIYRNELRDGWPKASLPVEPIDVAKEVEKVFFQAAQDPLGLDFFHRVDSKERERVNSYTRPSSKSQTIRWPSIYWEHCSSSSSSRR